MIYCLALCFVLKRKMMSLIIDHLGVLIEILEQTVSLSDLFSPEKAKGHFLSRDDFLF